LYQYNKKQGIFNEVKGFDQIYKPEIIKNNPKYFTSTRNFNCEALSWISNLYSIHNHKITFEGEIIKIANNDEFRTMVVELFEIDKKNENRKTLIDRQMSCSLQRKPSHRPCCYCKLLGNTLY
jgi:hypothetical protein